MGPIYATRLSILPDAAHPPQRLHTDTVALCHTWLRKVGALHGLAVPRDADTEVDLRNADATVVLRTQHLIPGADGAWQGEITVPSTGTGAAGDRNLEVRVEMQVRHDGDEEVVTVRSFLGSTVDHVRPRPLKLRPPSIVTTLVDAFEEVAVGNVTASTTARRLKPNEMGRLVHEMTRSDRHAPIVVVSRDDNGRLLCDVDALAEGIVGLGRVWVLPDVNSSYRLSDAVGKSLSCYLGAVRVYWPGFSTSDDQFAHRIWMPWQARLEDEELPSILHRILADASVIGIGPDAVATHLHHTAVARRTQTVVDQARTAGASEVETVYYDLLQQFEQLQAEHARLTDDLRTVRFQSSARQEAMAMRPAQADVDAAAFGERALRARSVIEAVTLIDEIADPASLVFLPAALESAEKGGFNNDLAFAWHLLFLLQRGAERFHRDPHARLLETMEDVGATREQFKPATDDHTRGLYRTDYERRWGRPDGRQETIEMSPHLSNGKGNAGKSLFIYWHVDLECRTFVVGHIGPKLRDTTGGYRA